MHPRLPLLVFLSFFSVAFSADPGRKAITHQDLWLMKRVGAPQPSPDGKWVVFTVIDPAYDAKDQVSDLWIAAVDGGSEPRRLTQSKGSESGARWSPDSRRIVFSAKRDGDEVAQLHVLDVAGGGEAERFTTLSTGARSPEWSPDGRQLLFVSEVYPGAMDDEANRKAAKARKEQKHTARVYDGFPIRYWDHWLDEKRAHLFVQEAKAGAKPRDLLAGTKLAAGRGFAGRETDSGEDLPAAWAPDGRSIVFAAAITKDQAAHAPVPVQLFEVPVAGGEPRALTAGADSYGEPQFTRDGKSLAVLMDRGGDGKTYHHSRLATFPWPFDAAQRRVVSEGLDLAVNRFVEAPGGGAFYLTAEAGHQVKLFRVGRDGGPVEATGLPQEGCLAGLGTAGGYLVGARDSAARPAEIVRISPETRAVQPLTRFNDAKVSTLDLPALEHFTFRSPRGREIHNLLVRPAGFDPSRKYPLFVVIHGGPAPQFKDAWGMRWNYHLLAAPGYVLLLTNYSGSSGYAEAFGQAIQGDPLKGPADEINQAVDEALRRYAFIDGTRMAAGGASYGGHLANWLQATTTRYRCLISHAGLVNLESQWGTSDVIHSREVNNGGPVWEQGPVWREQNPVRLAGNHAKGTGWRTPMLLTVGENDYRVPMNNTLENWSFHQRLRIPSRLVVFPDENHWITKGENSRFWFGEVHAWLARWLNVAGGQD